MSCDHGKGENVGSQGALVARQTIKKAVPKVFLDKPKHVSLKFI